MSDEQEIMEDPIKYKRKVKARLAESLKDKKLNDIRWDIVNVRVAILREEIIEWCEAP